MTRYLQQVLFDVHGMILNPILWIEEIYSGRYKSLVLALFFFFFFSFLFFFFILSESPCQYVESKATLIAN